MLLISLFNKIISDLTHIMNFNCSIDMVKTNKLHADKLYILNFNYSKLCPETNDMNSFALSFSIEETTERYS